MFFTMVKLVYFLTCLQLPFVEIMLPPNLQARMKLITLFIVLLLFKTVFFFLNVCPFIIIRLFLKLLIQLKVKVLYYLVISKYILAIQYHMCSKAVTSYLLASICCLICACLFGQEFLVLFCLFVFHLLFSKTGLFHETFLTSR